MRVRHFSAFSMWALCCVILVMGLLAGFAPQQLGFEVRRKAEQRVLVLRHGDMPEPIVSRQDEGHVWSLRRKVGENRPMTERKDDASRDDSHDVVIFENGGVRLDFGGMSHSFADAPASQASLSPLLSLDGMTTPLLVGAQPVLYGEALDAGGHPLRWRDRAGLLLLGYMHSPVGRAVFRAEEEKEEESSPAKPARPAPVFRAGPPRRTNAAQLREVVESNARRYGMSPALIYAVIHSESSFRPALVSSRSAMGLMQLLPSTAGGEVHRYLYGRRGNVSFEDLSDPETNIRYGTAYMHILLTRYLQGVRDPASREYCMMAAYNMGPNRLLRYFGATQAEAFRAINALGPDEVFRVLTQELPVRETRFYVMKVQHYRQAYAGLRLPSAAPAGN